ncbi:hypothetical protein NDU88_005249 [Pleurodeles waltl]|uniref:Uncharacterized protein n=1 Tax=Pleurodeles waltl TaxID=8319 RepID=A0AAV7SL35_PLEWA|nr:hypothetical protein NDU88_005249 [Pleurodeles waltl]
MRSLGPREPTRTRLLFRRCTSQAHVLGRGCIYLHRGRRDTWLHTRQWAVSGGLAMSPRRSRQDTTVVAWKASQTAEHSASCASSPGHVALSL